MCVVDRKKIELKNGVEDECQRNERYDVCFPLDGADRFFKEASCNYFVEDISEVEDDCESSQAADNVIFFHGWVFYFSVRCSRSRTRSNAAPACE